MTKRKIAGWMTPAVVATLALGGCLEDGVVGPAGPGSTVLELELEVSTATLPIVKEFELEGWSASSSGWTASAYILLGGSWFELPVPDGTGWRSVSWDPPYVGFRGCEGQTVRAVVRLP